MPRKGRKLKLLKKGQLIGSETANELIRFYNAFTSAKIENASANDVLMSDNNIVLQINSSPNSGTTTPSGPVWLP